MKHLPVPQHSLYVRLWSDSASSDGACEHWGTPAVSWFVKVGTTWYSEQRMTHLWGQLTPPAERISSSHVPRLLLQRLSTAFLSCSQTSPAPGSLSFTQAAPGSRLPPDTWGRPMQVKQKGRS